MQGIAKALARVNVDEEIQMKKLVGSNFDGASVMMGSRAGVATRLKKRIGDHHVSIHCVAHNLELAISDTIKILPYYEKFQDTIKSIFKFYFYSPKKRRELASISELLEEDKVHFGGIKTIRWLASQHRALKAIQKHYPTTVTHHENTASSSKGEDGNKAKKFAHDIKSEKFVKVMHFMIDVTAVIAKLSKEFQNEGVFVCTKIEKAKLQLNEVKDEGECYALFSANYSDQSHELHCGKNTVKLLNPGADTKGLFNSIVDNVCKYIDERFMTLESPPFSNFCIFDCRFWPKGRQELAKHGNDDIRALTMCCSVLPQSAEESTVFDQ